MLAKPEEVSFLRPMLHALLEVIIIFDYFLRLGDVKFKTRQVDIEVHRIELEQFGINEIHIPLAEFSEAVVR